MKLRHVELGLSLYQGEAAQAVLDGLHRGCRVIVDPPYGAGKYPTDKALPDELFAQLIDESETCAIFGWPEDLVALCVRLQRTPNEWVTWWSPNKCEPRANNLREDESIAVFGHVPGRKRIKRPRSRACKYAMTRYPGSSRARVSSGPLDEAQDGAVWRINAPGIGFNHANRLHPNEKPLELMERLVLLCSNEHDIVLDPCCGSGTTLLATKRLQRQAIGVELVGRHVETAVERLRQGVLPLGASA